MTISFTANLFWLCDTFILRLHEHPSTEMVNWFCVCITHALLLTFWSCMWILLDVLIWWAMCLHHTSGGVFILVFNLLTCQEDSQGAVVGINNRAFRFCGCICDMCNVIHNSCEFILKAFYVHIIIICKLGVDFGLCMRPRVHYNELLVRWWQCIVAHLQAWTWYLNCYKLAGTYSNCSGVVLGDLSSGSIFRKKGTAKAYVSALSDTIIITEVLRSTCIPSLQAHLLRS